MRQDYFDNLSRLLVQEFHIWQDLFRLANQDRRALLDCDLPTLTRLSSQKAAGLLALSACQTSRCSLLDSIESDGGMDSEAPPRDALQWLMNSLPAGQADSLRQLALGVQTLGERIAELVQGNYALADCAQRRLWVLQGWAQQEQQQSLPELLTYLFESRPELPAYQPAPVMQERVSNPVFGQCDRDFFAEIIAAGNQTSR